MAFYGNTTIKNWFYKIKTKKNNNANTIEFSNNERLEPADLIIQGTANQISVVGDLDNNTITISIDDSYITISGNEEDSVQTLTFGNGESIKFVTNTGIAQSKVQIYELNEEILLPSQEVENNG